MGAAPPVAAGAVAQPGAVDVGEQRNAPHGVGAEPLLPQDVHTSAVANAVLTTRTAAPKSRSAMAFPAFFVVTAGPDLAVLSDPSKEGKQVRRIRKVSVCVCVCVGGVDIQTNDCDSH